MDLVTNLRFAPPPHPAPHKAWFCYWLQTLLKAEVRLSLPAPCEMTTHWMTITTELSLKWAQFEQSIVDAAISQRRRLSA